MKTIRTGALFALLAILLGPVLLNLVGFILPFLSMAVDSVDAATGGRELLIQARRFVAPTSILFVIAAWLLTPAEPKENRGLFAFRMMARVSAVAWLGVSILIMLRIDVRQYSSIAFTALALFGLLQLARICRNLGHRRLAAVTVVALVAGGTAGLLPAPDANSPSSLMLWSTAWTALTVAATVAVIVVLIRLRRIPASP